MTALSGATKTSWPATLIFWVAGSIMRCDDCSGVSSTTLVAAFALNSPVDLDMADFGEETNIFAASGRLNMREQMKTQERATAISAAARMRHRDFLIGLDGCGFAVALSISLLNSLWAASLYSYPSSLLSLFILSFRYTGHVARIQECDITMMGERTSQGLSAIRRDNSQYLDYLGIKRAELVGRV